MKMTIKITAAEYFTGDKPARACYQAAALPLGVKVEIEAIAVR